MPWCGAAPRASEVEIPRGQKPAGDGGPDDEAQNIKAPTPAPSATPAETAIDQGELRRSFIRGICAAVAKQERYPPLARKKGWQGEVPLRVVIDASGHLLEVSVQRGSGYDILDREAVEMVKRAAPFPLLAGMKKEDVLITFPVRFRLESPFETAVHRGSVAYERGDYDGAIQAFEESLKLVPGDPDALRWLQLVKEAQEKAVMDIQIR
jgi:protein TonB